MVGTMLKSAVAEAFGTLSVRQRYQMPLTMIRMSYFQWLLIEEDVVMIVPVTVVSILPVGVGGIPAWAWTTGNCRRKQVALSLLLREMPYLASSENDFEKTVCSAKMNAFDWRLLDCGEQKCMNE